MELHRHTLALKLVIVAILGIVLTACGGDGDDEEPTATTEPGAAQPTVAETPEDEVVDLVSTPDGEPDSTPPGDTPMNTDMSSPQPGSTPEGDDESPPQASGNVSEEETATPESAAFDGTPQPESAAGTPIANGGADEAVGDPVATPSNGEPDDDPDAVPGDGTTGAPDADDVTDVDASTPDAPTPADGADATPEASDEPVVVEGCDVADVPPFTGETTAYVLSVDVNFRAGPGTDCDQVGDGPLGEFTPVEVIGGPVVRADDDEFQWVQVQVGESTGWLAFEFLEPVEE